MLTPQKLSINFLFQSALYLQERMGIANRIPSKRILTVDPQIQQVSQSQVKVNSKSSQGQF